MPKSSPELLLPFLQDFDWDKFEKGEYLSFILGGQHSAVATIQQLEDLPSDMRSTYPNKFSVKLYWGCSPSEAVQIGKVHTQTTESTFMDTKAKDNLIEARKKTALLTECEALR